MKKRVKSKPNSEKKGFVWYSLIISFVFILIFLTLVFTGIKTPFDWILGLFFYFMLPLNLIVSIISLIKSKKKILAIISLVMNVFILLLILIGLLV